MMIHTKCPIDGSDDSDVELYPANFDSNQVTPEVFSARRMTDHIHYRMVRNTRTGCVRADPILDSETVLNLYRKSSVTDAETAQLAAKTYLKYLKHALPLLPDRRGVLEIGCGHGMFLQQLDGLGFGVLKGLELSEDALTKAPAALQPHIVQKPLEVGLFDSSTFSLVCGFQVLDHLPDPNACLRSAYEALVPGGIMYWICHDVDSFFARILGRRCPIIDIEHVVLYNRRTIKALFEHCGFEVIDIFGVRNSYPLDYWMRLAPVPLVLKGSARKVLDISGLGRCRLTANLGNMGLVARKPADS